MTDSYIQVPPNSTGSKVDTSELTVNGATVERQRIVIGDPTNAGSLASVSGDGALITQSADQDMQWETLCQLRRIALLLEIMLGKSVSLADVM